MNIAIVFGTRPEAIKMMPVVKALRRCPEFRLSVITTGQHRRMLDQVLAAFGERADLDLDLMRPEQTLEQLTAAILTRLPPALERIEPDLVLVHGDTTTALAAAMTAFYRHWRIGHVEAGLRSFDLNRPRPEEFNRVAIDAIADFAFAPTERARSNLLAEYNRRARIHVTGNTGIDALLHVSRLLDRDAETVQGISRRYDFLAPEKPVVLVTGHRRESFGEGFENICRGLSAVASRGDVQLLYPVHLNPQVHDIVTSRLAGERHIHLISPVDYLDMVYLMKRARIIVTDSGGLQEEGPALGKPVLVLRDVTERPEALEAEAVMLVGTEPARLKSAVDRLLDDCVHYAAVAQPRFPYGDGTAAEKIAGILLEELPR